MKYEQRFHEIPEGFPPEVIKLKEFLEEVVKKALPLKYPNTIREIVLEKNRDKKSHKTFSIILDCYKNYFIFQFDYKKDEISIKYHSACEEELGREITKLNTFFNAVAEKFPDYNTGWTFNKETFKTDFENIDMYINANKYNL